MTLRLNSFPTLPSLANLNTILLAGLLVTTGLLAGCATSTSPMGGAPINIDLDDAGFDNDLSWLDRNEYTRLQKLEDVHNSNFTVVVGKVFDKRSTRSYLKTTEKDKIIYEYDPDTLLLGSTAYVQNQLQKYLDNGANKPVVYVAEAELTDARVRIGKGDFFNGRNGKYVVDMTFNVLVRDADSLLIKQTPVRLRYEQRRNGSGGRQPTEAQDRSRIMLAINQAFEPAALELAHRIYRAHLRRGAGRIQ